MANRYWVGGSATWNATNTTNWSASSGGAGGASVPTSADSVFFDANSAVSGSLIVVFNAPTIGSFNGTGFVAQLFSSTPITVNSGNVNTGSTGTYSSARLTITGGGGGTLTASSSVSFNTTTISVNSGTTYNLSGTLRSTTLTITSGILGASGAVVRAASLVNTSSNNSTIGTLSSTADANTTSCSITNNSSGNVTVSTLKFPSLLKTTGTGRIIASAISSWFSSFAVEINSSGGITIPAFPTSAQVTSLSITKTGSGAFSPLPTALSGYTNYTLTGALLSVTSATNIVNLTLADGAQAVSASAISTLNVSSNAAISGTVVFAGDSIITLNDNTQTNTIIGTLSLSGNQNIRFLNTTGSLGTIGTLNFGTGAGSRTLTLPAGKALRVLNLNVGASDTQIVTSDSHPTTRAKLEVVTSSSLTGIEWRSIDADGLVPFTGTGFIDGGNNLDIDFGGIMMTGGLFFGSNF